MLRSGVIDSMRELIWTVVERVVGPDRLYRLSGIARARYRRAEMRADALLDSAQQGVLDALHNEAKTERYCIEWVMQDGVEEAVARRAIEVLLARRSIVRRDGDLSLGG